MVALGASLGQWPTSCMCLQSVLQAQIADTCTILADVPNVGGPPQVFMTEVSKKVGRPIAFKGDAVDGTGTAAASSSGATVTEGLETVEQMQNPVFQAHKAGFTVGTHVVMKESEEAMVWIVKRYDGANVVLLKQDKGFDTGTPEVVEASMLLDKWKLYKGTVTIPLQGWDFDETPHSPLDSEIWKYECVKGAIQLGVRQTFKAMYPVTKDIQMFVRPNIVKVKSKWEAGELVVAPATYKIDRKETTGAIACGRFDIGGKDLTTLYLAPTFTPPVNAKGEANKLPWVSVFWHIPGTDKGRKGNMALKVALQQIGDVSVKVPALVNTKVVDAGAELCWDKSSAKGVIGIRTHVDNGECQKCFKRRKLV